MTCVTLWMVQHVWRLGVTRHLDLTQNRGVTRFNSTNHNTSVCVHNMLQCCKLQKFSYLQRIKHNLWEPNARIISCYMSWPRHTCTSTWQRAWRFFRCVYDAWERVSASFCFFQLSSFFIFIPTLILFELGPTKEFLEILKCLNRGKISLKRHVSSM